MLKIIGSCVVIISTTGIGCLMSAQASGRLRELKTIQRLVMLLKGEISYGKSTLPEALERISRKVDEPFAVFLEKLSQKARAYQGKSFAELFHEGIKEQLKGCNLTKTDLEGFAEIGQYLGYLDLAMQINTLDLYLQELEMVIQEVGNAIPMKKKLYQSLGIVSGLFLAIALV